MAGEHLITVTFPDVSGLPRDNTVMTFASVNDPTAHAPADLADFFNGANTHAPLCNYLSKTLSRGSLATIVRSYALDTPTKLAGGPHGSPDAEGFFTLGATGTDIELPSQCAMCISIQGDFGSRSEVGAVGTIPTPEAAQDAGAPATHMAPTHPKARRRGRIYFGPLDQMAKNNDGDPTSNFITDLAVAAARLLATSITNGWTWGQWSRSDASVNPVGGGFVDNRFDTQRRRLEAASGRTLWT